MSRATPKTRDFAARLIAHERKGTKSSQPNVPAAFYVCEKLRPYLATLMGSAGFHSLLSRALAVANAEDPLLRAVWVKEDGSLAAPNEKLVDINKMAEGSVLLVAQLFGLLMAFIGEELTLRMVREVWPKFPLNDFEFR